MPASVVKSFADKTGKSVDEVEKLWNKAKQEAKDAGHADEYDYITGILKKMLKMEETQTGDVAKPDMPMGAPVARQPDGKGPYGHPYFQIDCPKTFSKMLDRRSKGERWKNIVGDEGIRNWVKKNRLKTFYLKHNGVFVCATSKK